MSVFLIFFETTEPFKPIVSWSMIISNNIQNGVPIQHVIWPQQNIAISGLLKCENFSQKSWDHIIEMLLECFLISFQCDISYGLQMSKLEWSCCFGIQSCLSEQFSTRTRSKCWYLPNIFLKVNMRRFSKSPWHNSLVLRRLWHSKTSEIKLQALLWLQVVTYKLDTRKAGWYISFKV